MKILLMSLNSKFIHTNLALYSLKKYFEAYYPIDLCQMEVKEYTINNEMDNVLRNIDKGRYTHIFVSTYIWNIEPLTILFSNYRKINQDCKIIFGGPEVTYNAVEQLEKLDFLDAVIFGEGEHTFGELISNISVNGYDAGVEQTLGVAYRNGTSIIKNNPMPLISPLDKIPFPYELLDAFENKIIYYESSRGCPYSCSYCLSSAVQGLRHLDFERVKKDLDFFLMHRVDQVKFVDRTFNALKTHALPILKYLVHNDNGITNFHFEITATLLDDDYFEVLKKARPGLFQFEIGVQTTHKPTMHAINRPIAFDKLNEVCQILLEMGGIHIHLDLIAGLPYENFNDFLRSFDDVYDIGAEQLQLGFLKILKGTAISTTTEEHGYKIRMQAPYEVLCNRYITFDELSQLKEIEILVEYYANSGKFRHALKFIMKKMALTPSVFYLKFARFFSQNDYFSSPIGTYRLYEILYSYYEVCFGESDLFKDLLKVDYYYSNLKGQKPLFNYIEIPNFNNKRLDILKDAHFQIQFLNEISNLSAKQLLKNVEFITLKYDIISLIQKDYKDDKEDCEQLTVIMFHYNNPQAVQMIKVDLDRFQSENQTI